MTFIDNYNTKLWAFMMKSKDQVLSVFKEFDVRIEREPKQKLKAIKTNNGGEYKGQFEQHCKGLGIKLEYTMPKC